MASRANGVGKARGALLIQPSGEEANARRTEVVTGRVEEQWESVRRFVGDKESKGRIRCLKLERMIESLIYGERHGHYHLTIGTAAQQDDYRGGVPDFHSLRRARIKAYVVKREGTNKARPIYGGVKLTSDDLLWACRDEDSPATIGGYSTGKLPHFIVVMYANWVSRLPDDRAREAQLFDLLKCVSWKGEEHQGQIFEVVGHEIMVNRDTLNLYEKSVNDTFVVAQAIRPHARQLGFPTDALNPRDSYEQARAYIEGMGALLFRPSDNVVIDFDGNTLYAVSPLVAPIEGDGVNVAPVFTAEEALARFQGAVIIDTDDDDEDDGPEDEERDGEPEDDEDGGDDDEDFTTEI